MSCALPAPVMFAPLTPITIQAVLTVPQAMLPLVGSVRHAPLHYKIAQAVAHPPHALPVKAVIS